MWLKFEVSNSNNKKYKIEGIWGTIVYIKVLESGYLPGRYYLILQKGYPEKKNT